MTTSVSPIYAQYKDLDGQPLENGYIYVGTANQNPETAPIAIYFDPAGTQPAAQPLRTSNGFIYRAGTPTNVFAAANYSLTVRNQQGELVFTVASASEASSIGEIVQNLIVQGDTILGDETTGGSTTVILGTGDTFEITNVAGDVTYFEVTEDGDTTITVPAGQTFTVTGDGDTVFQTDVINDGNTTTFINGATIDLPDGTVEISDLSPEVLALINGGSGGAGSVPSAIRGLVAVNNGGTSTTQVDLDADTCVFYNPSDESSFADNSIASCTVNIATAGPILNGRDQAAAFANGTWVYFYRIWGSGQTEGGISTSVAPESGGPVLPTGYTHWCYCTAHYLTAGGALKLVKTIGATAYYNDATFPAGAGAGNALANGTATTITSVDVSGFLPPHTVRFNMFLANAIVSTGGGVVSLTTQFFGENSLGISSNTFSMSGLANSTQAIFTFGLQEFPNTDQTFEYKNVVNAGSSPETNAYMINYILPNGDT